MYFNVREPEPDHVSARTSVEPRRRGARRAGCPKHQTARGRALALSMRLAGAGGFPCRDPETLF